jgi:hypothetical protein
VIPCLLPVLRGLGQGWLCRPAFNNTYTAGSGVRVSNGNRISPVFGENRKCLALGLNRYGEIVRRVAYVASNEARVPRMANPTVTRRRVGF